jgi:hypothetical protein
MSRGFYLIFLSVATAMNVGVLLELDNTLIEIVYILLLSNVIFNYLFGRIPAFVWTKGLSIIGITSLFSLVLMLIGGYTMISKKIEACIFLYVWVKSLRYMAEWENKNLEE